MRPPFDRYGVSQLHESNMAKVIESIIPLEQTYGTNRVILYPERTVSSETMLRIYFMHN